ncbi:Sucrase/ferredoxin-like-domain-containing protein [Poronia punctata]|nr:Sucrase/ferredoxin-like-domain-containing protein [Poronia punctata]
MVLRPLAARAAFLNTVPKCPAPTCECAETPEMPEDLPIDREAKLDGLISNYAEQVLVCTGRSDWPSRIEEANSGDNLAADLKEMIGRGGVFSDPFHNISVLNSSFPPSTSRRPEVQATSAYLLPSFKYVPYLSRVSFDSMQALVKGYLLPEKLHPMNDKLPAIHKDRLTRKEAYRHLLVGVRDVDDVLVLICGHGGRDKRCGIFGPVLQAEFERQLPQAGLELLNGPVVAESVSVPPLPGTGEGDKPTTARVGLISHIGGHKFAGNVIIYLPPRLKNNGGNPHPLAGHGIWYGRVEPKHVEGLIQETIVKGNVIKEHFRGGITQDRKILSGTTAPNGKGSPWVILALIFTASAGTAYLYRRKSSTDDDVINMSTFSSFTIVKREQVSPTAFIITLRPSGWVGPKELAPGHDGDGEKIGFLSRRIQDAWRHGLWSVEIKQPQLQIARHYTPLPPLYENAISSAASTSGKSITTQIKEEYDEGEEEEEELADLRFLIRRMDGGEMSNYLSRQRVGDTVWLRGPHLGFDVARRLGTEHNTDTAARHQGRRVVFLAGGTGIAPALQLAHKLLDTGDDRSLGKPHISILWANRHGADALGREFVSASASATSSRGWFGFLWGRTKENQDRSSQTVENPPPPLLLPPPPPTSSLELQIRDLKKRHGSNLEISYFVDDEGSFIKSRDLEVALARAPATHPAAAAGIDDGCTWHSAKAIQVLPDDNDAARSPSTYPCTCARPPGANLIFVSGPDGFIAAYAGAKRWHEGHEMQGVVGGVLGRLKRDDKGKLMEGWNVLKL